MGDYASIHVFNLLKRKFFGNLNLTLTGRNYYEADVKVSNGLNILLRINTILPHYFYFLAK